MRLTVSHGAVADLDRLHEFLVEKDSSAAQRAARTIDDAVRSLTDFPQRGRPSGIAGVAVWAGKRVLRACRLRNARRLRRGLRRSGGRRIRPNLEVHGPTNYFLVIDLY